MRFCSEASVSTMARRYRGGSLISLDGGTECFIPAANSGCTCTRDENGNITELNETLICKVIPETIGQYTGLTDDNGKEIFEGDIVKSYGYALAVVFEQRNGAAYFGLACSSSETLPFGYYLDLPMEVIGNIHDNPELLENTEKEGAE